MHRSDNQSTLLKCMLVSCLLLSINVFRGAFTRPACAGNNSIQGPLRVHPDNPRYFTDDSRKAIYVTGSHTWYNLQDSGTIGEPLTRFDYNAYLDLLQSSGHNFMRMWAWEGGVNERYCEPLAYSRTGPGTALDGKPKFDLKQFNQEYFDRLRSRVVAAGQRGIYVSIMLLQGWSIYSHGYGNPWPLHPFNKANNVNGLDGDPNADGEGKEVHTLQVPAITALQQAYVRKVIDTVNDLDNVLYEITNETAIFSKDWQYHVVKYIKSYEATKPKRHPVGMTAFDSGRAGSMAALWASPADWISPQNDGTAGDFRHDPPAADGRKVMISDTDHLWGVGGGRTWAWKSFTRGLHSIYMDPITKPDGTVETLWKEARKGNGAYPPLGQTNESDEHGSSQRPRLNPLLPRASANGVSGLSAGRRSGDGGPVRREGDVAGRMDPSCRRDCEVSSPHPGRRQTPLPDTFQW